MQRISCVGSFALLSLGLWLGVGESARGQDRAGAAMAAGQPPPPPGAGALPPPRGGGEGGGVMQPGEPPPVPGAALPPAAGGIGIGTIPVTPPPPIGFYAPARAVDYNMGKFFYYPFYYYPHSYWPTESCPWPERPGQPYMRPPAYMSYPPFLEPHWRYEWYVPQKYYRGFHFWLDQF
ncbi:MAG TPA: hypothetical protein VH643_22560 [Gemmataceae bacterium]|jgi:hypothetical protein